MSAFIASSRRTSSALDGSDFRAVPDFLEDFFIDFCADWGGFSDLGLVEATGYSETTGSYLSSSEIGSLA